MKIKISFYFQYNHNGFQKILISHSPCFGCPFPGAEAAPLPVAERLIPVRLGNALHGSKATWCWWDDRVVSSISGLDVHAGQIELELGKVASYLLPQ